MSKKKETNVLCPQCGTKFATPDKERTAVATIIGKDSGLGTVYLPVEEDKEPAKLPKTAQARIEALRDAGVDVSHLFAMHGANGDEYLVSQKDGMISILDDNDPIFKYITEQGTVPNRHLFRRWVMAQMFHFLSHTDFRQKEPVGVTEMIHRLGYEYQWKMLKNELYAQKKMEGRDMENFTDRNRWFDVRLATYMAMDYIDKAMKHIASLKSRNYRGAPYKRIGGYNVLESEIHKKVFLPLYEVMPRIRQAKNATQLYNAVKKFDSTRFKLPYETPQCREWVDAYKGSGAFFTMQNLIRFHDCTAIDDEGKELDKCRSLAFLSAKAEAYKSGGGWRMLAVLKKMLKDNGIDIKKKMREWRRKK